MEIGTCLPWEYGYKMPNPNESLGSCSVPAEQRTVELFFYFLDDPREFRVHGNIFKLRSSEPVVKEPPQAS